MSNKVHNIIKSGLQHGKYYKVYVTQVNTRGIESPRSSSGIIRVGDIEAPPVPVLSLDVSQYANGCYTEGATVNIMLKWTESVCDDLANYICYRWRNLESYVGDGQYPSSVVNTATTQVLLTNTTLSGTSSGNPPGEYVYFGIQAVDLSHNYSNVYIIKVLSEDITAVPVPATAPNVEPYGIWCLKVSTDNPAYSNISEVVFFRDGWKELPAVKFYKGLTAEYYDTLDVLDGLSHFYTYLYVTKDGRRSAMSPASTTVTAKPIDTSYIDKIALEELRIAWQSETLSTISDMKEAAMLQAQKIQELANQLKDVTTDYNELYNKYVVTANELSLLSAKVETDEGIISTYGTSIEQNAKDITLRATKGDIDTATGQLQAAMVAMINIQADRISSVVSDTSGYSSQITQLSNAIQQKVSVGDLKSEIDLAVQDGISVAYIKADRIVLSGQMLLQGDARINGKLYSNDIALIDSATNQVIWGSGTGTLHPAVTDLSWNVWSYCMPANTQGSWVRAWGFYYTPRPPVDFNGTCTVTITMNVYVGLGYNSSSHYDDKWWAQAPSTFFGLTTSAEGTFQDTSVHPRVNPSANNWQKGVSNITIDGHYYDVTTYTLITLSYKGTMRIGEQIDVQVWFKNIELGNPADGLLIDVSSVHLEAI